MSWWDYVVKLCGCGECAAMLVTILGALAGLLADRGPRVSKVLQWLADLIRGAPKFPDVKAAAVVLALLFCGGVASAAPVEDKSCDCCKPTCTCKPNGPMPHKNGDCACYPCQCDPKPPAPAGRIGETIITTRGESFTRAADGQFYPSAHVRPDGSVSLTPLYQGCPGGRCPAPPLYYAQPHPAIQPPAQGGCPGGNCPAPGRPVIRR